MSFTTDIVVYGLGKREIEFIEERLGEWEAETDDHRHQRLVDVTDHSGGTKYPKHTWLAAFNYGPYVSDWRKWFDDVITKFHASPVIVIDQEGDQVVYVQGHGWVERSWDGEGGVVPNAE